MLSWLFTFAQINIMETEIFTLCDFAQDAGGKLTIVGTFDQISSANFPVTILPALPWLAACVFLKRKRARITSNLD